MKCLIIVLFLTSYVSADCLFQYNTCWNQKLQVDTHLPKSKICNEIQLHSCLNKKQNKRR
jgi:hypothetical protein